MEIVENKVVNKDALFPNTDPMRNALKNCLGANQFLTTTWIPKA